MITAIDLKRATTVLMYNRKKRSIALLITTIVIFLGIFIYRFVTTPAPPPEGVLTWYMCESCGHTGTMIIKDISDHDKYRCPKCGGYIKQVYKCTTCGYEFPYERPQFETKKMRTYDVLTKLRDLRRCPNCGADTVFPKPAE